jgi:hypothetical protein
MPGEKTKQREGGKGGRKMNEGRKMIEKTS